MVSLDEINEAIDFNLTPLDEMIHLIKNRPPALDFNLTGPYAYPEVIALADIVSEVVDIKRHYNAGIRDRAGIEY